MTINGAAARAGAGEAPPPGLLHPLRHHGFALTAGAALVSNIGVWMRDTTLAWTDLQARVVANWSAYGYPIPLAQVQT